MKGRCERLTGNEDMIQGRRRRGRVPEEEYMKWKMGRGEAGKRERERRREKQRKDLLVTEDEMQEGEQRKRTVKKWERTINDQR